ncbi:MAG: glycosyltransferase family 39 protein [Victivallaceae bacterium]|nr:glycosyltransferase family 39 protein [Victivallaceae bacterium]
MKSEKHISPLAVLLIYMAASMLVWTLQCSLLQNVLGMDILETIMWGAQMALGHAKHPPLSGWIGYLVSAASGYADWSMYMLCQVCIVSGVLFVYALARQRWDEYRSAVAAMLLYFLHYYTPSDMKFSTYFVEMALAPAAAYFLYTAVTTDNPLRWAAFGLASGLGILNKYSFGLFMLAFAIAFLSNRDARRKLATSGPYLAMAVFAITISPHVVWLAGNDFICFGHGTGRVENDWTWDQPFVSTGTALYPFAMELLALVLAWLPARKSAKRTQEGTVFLVPSLVVSIVPPLALIILTMTGNAVVMLWFCTMASWTGIAMVAMWPFEIDRGMFHRMFIWLLAFTAAMVIGTTLDLLYRTSYRLHTEPMAIVQPAIEYWNSVRPGEKVPAVVGTRWFACVIENYTPERIPACESKDITSWNLHKDVILRDGALLIGNAEDFRQFEQWTGRKVKLEKRKFKFKSLLGKEKERSIMFGIFDGEKNLVREEPAVRLWQGDAPLARGANDADIPTLTPFVPAEPNGTAVLVLPGGGYRMLARHEGPELAKYLALHGVTAFVLKYRLGSDGYRHPAMLLDATRAMRTIRAMAGKYGIRPDCVGVMGSSAGGHLAATLMTNCDAGRPDDADSVERESSRPDFGMLCYPVISMTPPLTHEGSRKMLLGDVDNAEAAKMSADLNVTEKTPKCFIWHTSMDQAVPPDNSIAFYSALRRNNVPCELHIYQNGRHGQGLKDVYPYKNALPWADAMTSWMKINGLLP